MPFAIIRDDISRVHADALVNAANTRLAPGGGVCGAIFEAAGFDDMRRACASIGRCATGDAVVTPAFALPARWCIHAVGPIWRGGGAGEEDALRRCYRSIFARVVELGARSVAFPLISAGIYGFPAAQALAIARDETRSFLAEHDDVDATLVVFDRGVVRASSRLFDDIQRYIDDEYFAQHAPARRRGGELEQERAWADEEAGAPAPATALGDAALAHDALTDDLGPHAAAATAAAAEPMAAPPVAARLDASATAPDLDRLLRSLDASFSSTLLALIDARGLTDAQVYHRANISRQLFSKIRGNDSYRPTKQTAVALIMALELDLPTAQDLLGRAGLTLSRSSVFDVIVRFFIERGIYDLYQLNEALFAYDQPLVGSL